MLHLYYTYPKLLMDVLVGFVYLIFLVIGKGLLCIFIDIFDPYVAQYNNKTSYIV